jgi:hypothetical protein
MNKTYTVWIGEAKFYGWSVLTDYGRPGEECVVTSPHNREDCISALAPYMDEAGALALEWEAVSRVHDAWINQVRADRGVHWAPCRPVSGEPESLRSEGLYKLPREDIVKPVRQEGPKR